MLYEYFLRAYLFTTMKILFFTSIITSIFCTSIFLRAYLFTTIFFYEHNYLRALWKMKFKPTGKFEKKKKSNKQQKYNVRMAKTNNLFFFSKKNNLGEHTFSLNTFWNLFITHTKMNELFTSIFFTMIVCTTIVFFLRWHYLREILLTKKFVRDQFKF